MQTLMYDLSVPTFQEGLSHAAAILQKALSYAEGHGVDPATYVTGRLYPDMYPLALQVRGITTLAMVVSSRIATDAPPFAPINVDEDTATFADFQHWIDQSRRYLAQLQPAQFADAADKEVIFPLRAVACRFTGKSYLVRFGLPNFYFHATVLYAILRSQGVPLGKSDFVLPEYTGAPTFFGDYPG
jgi:hypothetical protein